MSMVGALLDAWALGGVQTEVEAQGAVEDNALEAPAQAAWSSDSLHDYLAACLMCESRWSQFGLDCMATGATRASDQHSQYTAGQSLCAQEALWMQRGDAKD